MRTLPEFIMQNPESWKAFGIANKVITALYITDTPLTEEEVAEILKKELSEAQVITNLKYLHKNSQEIEIIENSEGKKYFLTPQARESFGVLYDRKTRKQI